MTYELTTIHTRDGMVAVIEFDDGTTLSAKQLAHAASLMDRTATHQHLADAQGLLAWADSTRCSHCHELPVVARRGDLVLCDDCEDVARRKGAAA